MKKVLCIVTSLLVVSAFGAFAKEAQIESASPRVHQMKALTLESIGSDEVGSLSSSAGADTVFFGNWNFTTGPSCVDDGWVPQDFSEQIDEFWHVDDFAGLGGGSFGGLTAIEGAQSLWMGSRTHGLEALDLCGYATLPGYGNSWSQKWCTKTCLNVGSDVTVVFVGKWDSEPGYDGTTLQISTCTANVPDNNWLATRPTLSPGGHWDGLNGGIGVPATVGPDSLIVESVPDSMHTGSIQIRLLFEADGGWSDEDGLWDTDGAIIVDSLSVSDNGGTVLAVEDFEGEASGAISATDWESCNEVGFSSGQNAGGYNNAFGDLFPALTLLQEDPCVTELGCVWAFIQGSTDNYACGGFLGQTVVPFGPNARNQYIQEEIVSPIIPFATTSTDIQLAAYRYTDLPLDNLVFYTYGVRSFVAGCPTNWRDDNFVYRDPDKSWATVIFILGDKLQVGATDIQIKTGVRDMCAVWCGVFGTGACHSHGPLMGQIWLYAIESSGPQMQWAAGGMLNDNFPTDGTLTGTARIDAAIDIRPSGNAIIANGDSASITVNEPLFGLSTNALAGGKAGMASVYAYVGVYNGGAPAGYSGDQIVDTPSRFPVIDSLTAPDGGKWFIVEHDTSFSPAGGPVLNRFCFDLHDSRFVGGDEIRYFLAAQSADGPGSWTYFYDAEHSTDLANHAAGFAPGSTPDINVAFANYQEVSVLPTGNSSVDVLYVDASSGRRTQPYYDTAFDQLGVVVDRFDISQSGSSASGAFGHRVQDVFAQLIPSYRKIIWDSGDLTATTIGDGTSATTGTGSMKTDDWAILFPFIDQHDNLPGILLAGNSLGSDWFAQVGQAAVDFKSVYMNYGLVTSNHQTLASFPLNPLAIGQAGGIFDHILGPDTVVAAGGCPTLRLLDVYSQTGNSVIASAYENDVTRVAILNQTTTNSVGQDAHVVLAGFGLRFLRDASISGVAARVTYLEDVFIYMENTVDVPTGTGSNPGLSNSLRQNYPNPFNPTTTIDYTLRASAPVQLNIYNVAGQLVKTLVNEFVDSGAYTVKWDGRNNAGQTVSSGVYFYKLTSENFVQTRKMVLLK